MDSEKTLDISIVLDTVCPWCYVGKRRLEKAVSLAREKWPEFAVNIDYLPYQLDTQIGKGLDKAEIYQKKFGNRAEAIIKRMSEAGRADGIEFKFSGKMSNTLDSHRLIDYAVRQKGAEGQEKVVESLMHRYFENEEDIGDVQVLLAAAEDGDLDRQEIAKYLESDEGVDEVKEKAARVQDLGISGVPFYIINNRFGISGAETPEVFLDTFAKVFDKCQS
ncbi:hypothetical protein IW140_002107 [Coemansia sp. RSA 1813]|nr:hypothetical protein EV178_001255 [Coemansia sp. RSA 1646]KAJ1772608.1 hypothetical protein LPJ74_001324 [Coemansia sp. RSA 1843]KAJ2091464.1 hypothetical protein IW138_001923 [Coemansia sp. RSA 986]KAJ2213873.1 hypothetical protein EV179_003457 [Coemansia sp. RSA 487]KAJ2570681.1 hypothetical protein IW140_002107 [Coemansia sp. RSA 1813]